MVSKAPIYDLKKFVEANLYRPKMNSSNISKKLHLVDLQYFAKILMFSMSY
jgi:hypothetical protein